MIMPTVLFPSTIMHRAKRTFVWSGLPSAFPKGLESSSLGFINNSVLFYIPQWIEERLVTKGTYF